MIRRKPTHVNSDGTANSNGHGHDNVATGMTSYGGGYGYGTPSATLGYPSNNASNSSHASASMGNTASLGGSPSNATGSVTTGYGYSGTSMTTQPPRYYTGYGTSSSTTGFGVGMGGGEIYSSSSTTSNDRMSLKGKKKKQARFNNSLVTLSRSLFRPDKFFFACLFSVMFLLLALYYRSHYRQVLLQFKVSSMADAKRSWEKLEMDQRKLQREVLMAKEGDKQLKQSIRELEKTNRELRKQQDEYKVQLDQKQVGLANPEQAKRCEAREEAWAKQVYLLQNATQRESKRAVLERFGPGPHHVLFSIAIPTDTEAFESGTFSVELAPLDEMPHATHLFLEQVYHELWDNTWFYLNGPHVLQAGPQDWEDESSGEALARFSDMRLDKLSFPEYSPNFPHVPWTIGFTGRPGGPDWYINKADNTKSHGPYGQHQHSLNEQADSCFAKVVDGKEILEKVFRMSVYPRGSGYDYFLEDAVEIISARLVEPLLEQTHHAATHVHHGTTLLKESTVTTSSHATTTTTKKAKLPKRLENNQEAWDEAKAEQIAEMMKQIELEAKGVEAH